VEELAAVLDGLVVQDTSVGQLVPLNNYSILMGVPSERKQALVGVAGRDCRLDRAMGSMCGMGVGDGVGHMFEFMPCRDRPGDAFFDLSTMSCHRQQNTFHLKMGQWTDDASMGLCIADSLIIRRCYDGSDIRQRFWNWWNRGYNNAFRLDKQRLTRHSVGLGGNISKSLSDMDRLRADQKPHPVFQSGGEDAGNGSLMRFAPLALFFHAVPHEDLFYFAAQSSFTTHPGVIAAEACALLAHIIVSALRRPSDEAVNPQAFLESTTAEYARLSGLDAKCESGDWRYRHVRWLVTGRPERGEERCWAWREQSLGLEDTLKARGQRYNGYPVSAGYFGSYSLDGLAIALWAVYHTGSFDEAVVKAINVLGDADSHGSICGQIAGALYGLQRVHPQFRTWLNRWDDHEFALRAVLLHELGSSLK
jgi:ADP-ribosyl-[dinitrogen reductase] hydrolase